MAFVIETAINVFLQILKIGVAVLGQRIKTKLENISITKIFTCYLTLKSQTTRVQLSAFLN